MGTSKVGTNENLGDIGNKMRKDGMSTADMIRAFHGKLGQMKEAAELLVADVQAAQLNAALNSHVTDVVKPTEKQQTANREALTPLAQDRRSVDAASSISTNADQLSSAMQAAADKRKKFIEELKRLISAINGAESDIQSKLNAGTLSTADIKNAIRELITGTHKAINEHGSKYLDLIETDKDIYKRSQKLYTTIRETAIAFAIPLPAAETPTLGQK